MARLLELSADGRVVHCFKARGDLWYSLDDLAAATGARDARMALDRALALYGSPAALVRHDVPGRRPAVFMSGAILSQVAGMLPWQFAQTVSRLLALLPGMALTAANYRPAKAKKRAPGGNRGLRRANQMMSRSW